MYNLYYMIWHNIIVFIIYCYVKCISFEIFWIRISSNLVSAPFFISSLLGNQMANTLGLQHPIDILHSFIICGVLSITFNMCFKLKFFY